MIPLEQIESYLSPPLLLCALVALGLAVGTLTGLFGVGGGFITTPLLNVLLGIPYNLAVGSDLCAIIATSSSGVQRHMRLRNFEARSMLVLAAASMIGAYFGADACMGLKGFCGHNFSRVMHSLFIVILLLTAWVVATGAGTSRTGRSLLQRLPLPPRLDLPQARLEGVSLPGLCLLGLVIGGLKGLMGIGGGVLFMPMLIVAVGLEAHQAIGTSLGVVLLSSLTGTAKHGLNGNVCLWIVCPLMVGGTIGVQAGAWLCQRFNAQRIRRYFSVLALAVATVIAIDLVRGLL